MLITHRTSVIGITNKLLLLNEGTAQLFGPTNEVLATLQKASQQAAQQAQQAQQAAAQAAQQRAVAPVPAQAVAAAAITEQE